MTVLKKYDAGTSQWETIVVGKQGPQGATGSQGPQGVQGETGPQGPQGDPGEGVAAGGTTGQSLVKASGTNYDTTWADRMLPYQVINRPYFISGRYYGPPINSTLTTAFSQDQLVCIPFAVPVAATFDRIGVSITTAAASSTVRLGIYEHDPATDMPADLVLDAGTVDSSTTGSKTITINTTLNPGIYFLAHASQGGAPTLRSYNAGLMFPLAPNAATSFPGSANINYISAKNGVTGAFPDPFDGTNNVALAARIYMRVA